MIAKSKMTKNTDNVPALYTTFTLPILSKSIRILDVNDCSSSEDGGPIQCGLRVIDLDSESQPQFAALSYVWGIETARSHSIICNSFAIAVTANCHSALQHLRKKLGKFTIWIDAICINQQDEEEKMKQIQFMGDIYSKAETVYTWLGESNVATNRAMTYLGNARYLDFFFSKDEQTEHELLKPTIWSAAWSSFAVRWSLTNNTLFPSLNHSKLPVLFRA